MFREGIDHAIDPVKGDVFSLSGALKMVSCTRHYLLNKLWINFAESLKHNPDKTVNFFPKGDFTEILIQLERDPRFKYFLKIIDIANNNPHLLLNNIYNLHEFVELSEVYGELFGLIGKSVPDHKELTVVVTATYTFIHLRPDEKLFARYRSEMKNRLMRGLNDRKL